MTESLSLAGRTLMVGLPGTELDAEVAERLRRLNPGGVILFRRNLESCRQTIELLDELRRLVTHPLLLALDQEGGRVSRLEPWIGSTPTASALACAGARATRRFGGATAAALSALGFNLDFAPVVDLSATDATNGIGDRSFGTDPRRVAELAGNFLDGLQAGGVAGCLKHFPGLGATTLDSHVQLPTAERNLDDLQRLDLEPYRRLGKRAASVMVGHAHYPALEPQRGRPATLSSVIVTDWLRGRLSYRGLVVGDDLEMGAVAALDEDGRAAVQALAAGCDMLLYCSELGRAELAAEAIACAARRDPAMQERLQQAARAVESLARRWPAAPGNEAAWDTASREIRGAISASSR